MNEELQKSLSDAIDTAIKELANIDMLSKSDISLQDAKLRPESANGDLPGVTVGESTLKPEDAKKTDDEDKDDKKEDKKDSDEDKKKDAGDDDDMDDEKAEKFKAKIKKYEDDKKAKNVTTFSAMTKSDLDSVSDSLKKSITSQVEEMHKSFGDRLTQIEGLINKLVSAPQPRQSVSGLAPLAKSMEDVQAAGQSQQLTKSKMIEKLFELQKSNDPRVDSVVISRVEMGDYLVLAERGINLK